MSEADEPVRHAAAQDGADGYTEEIDALPVLAMTARAAPMTEGEEARPGHPLRGLRATPALQAAAVAASGFIAGAAVVGLARWRHPQRLVRPRLGAGAGRGFVRRGGGSRQLRGERVEIVASRSLLVDVHLLGAREKARSQR